MVRFPLAARELTRNGRRVQTYILRLAGVGIVVPAAALAYSVSLLPGEPGNALSAVSWTLIYTSALFHLFVVAVLAPVMASRQIAPEKAERTLPLLLLADFRGWDIFAAKFLAIFLQTELLLLSTLPLYAIASILGGISVPMAAWQIGLMSLVLATACALGLLCSTLANRPRDALSATLIGLFVWLGGTAYVDAAVSFTWGGRALYISPVSVYAATADPDFSIGPHGLALALALLLLMVAAAATVWLLPRQIEDRPARKQRRRIRLKRRLWWPASPETRIAAAGTMGWGAALHRVPLRVVYALVLCALPLVVCGPIGTVIIMFLLAHDVITSIHDMRRHGVFDDLLVAPSSNRHLAAAIWRAHVGRALVYVPALAVATGWMMAVFPGRSLGLFEVASPGASLATLLLAGVFLLAIVIVACAQTYCIVALSCLMATTQTWPSVQAAIATGVFVVIHPFAATVVVLAGAVGTLLFSFTIGRGAIAEQAYVLALSTLVASMCYIGFGYLFYHTYALDFRYIALRARNT